MIELLALILAYGGLLAWLSARRRWVTVTALLAPFAALAIWVLIDRQGLEIATDTYPGLGSLFAIPFAIGILGVGLPWFVRSVRIES